MRGRGLFRPRIGGLSEENAQKAETAQCSPGPINPTNAPVKGEGGVCGRLDAAGRLQPAITRHQLIDRHDGCSRWVRHAGGEKVHS